MSLQGHELANCAADAAARKGHEGSTRHGSRGTSVLRTFFSQRLLSSAGEGGEMWNP